MVQAIDLLDIFSRIIQCLSDDLCRGACPQSAARVNPIRTYAPPGQSRAHLRGITLATFIEGPFMVTQGRVAPVGLGMPD